MLIEEILKGNLERECYEELCNYEEAREYFEDTEKTNTFWTIYKDGDQCAPNPCRNGGSCTDTIGGYKCNCAEHYTGENCERDVTQCLPDDPLGCTQFCRPGSYSSFICSCTTGYQLHKDGRSCYPAAKFPCGKVTPQSIQCSRSKEVINVTLPCPHGQCPWQALLINKTNQGFCNGVVLGQYWMITTASCIQMVDTFYVAVGSISKFYDPANVTNLSDQLLMAGHGEGQVLMPSYFHKHPRYQKEGGSDNLALLRLRDPIQFSSRVFPVCIPEKDYAENVLMLGRKGVVSSWKEKGTGENAHHINQLSYLPLKTCQERHNFTITNKMFCMDGAMKESCSLEPGSPVVTAYKGTAFLTGILLSETRDYDCSRGHLFSKISRYLPWINQYITKL
ncbi:protein Z, vitamin K-dependent plasma glycoprotein b isoform X2 [Amia ocellicauda]